MFVLSGVRPGLAEISSEPPHLAQRAPQAAWHLIRLKATDFRAERLEAPAGRMQPNRTTLIHKAAASHALLMCL